MDFHFLLERIHPKIIEYQLEHLVRHVRLLPLCRQEGCEGGEGAGVIFGERNLMMMVMMMMMMMMMYLFPDPQSLLELFASES